MHAWCVGITHTQTDTVASLLQYHEAQLKESYSGPRGHTDNLM